MRAVAPSHARAIARNTVLQSLGHVAGLGVAVASAALLTRYLGVRGYGTFSLLAVLLVLPSTVLNGSLDTLVVRHLSAGDGGQAFFRNVLALKIALAGAFALLVGVAAAAAPLGGPIRVALALLGISVVASGVQGTLLTVEQARMRFQLPVMVDVGGRTVTLLAVAALMLAPRPAGSIRVALVVAAGTAAAILWLALTVVLRRRRVSLCLRRDPDVWRSLLRGAGPLALLSVLGLVNYRLDVVLLGALAGARDVGIYAVATRFVDALLPLASFFVAASFPALSAGASLPRADRQRRARRAAEFLLLSSLPMVVGGCVFAPALVHGVAGPAYADAVLPLRLLLASVPLSYLSTFLVFMLIAADEQRRVMPLMIASIVLNLVLNVALIPRYGYDAPAVATLASELVGAIALVAVVRRALGVIPLAAALLKSPVAAAAMLATAILAHPLGAVPAAAASLAVYGVGVVALRVVRPVDLRLLVEGAT